jgi:glycosyltransferase involved in cell wall biosynthesis
VETGGGDVRLAILGGSERHAGGVEAFCARAADAVATLRPGWQVEQLPTNAAYLDARHLPQLLRGIGALGRMRGADVVWAQVATVADLVYARRAKALGCRLLVTPHLGANSRLQRSAPLRALCRRLMGAADRIALLYEGQEAEVALPAGVPTSVVGTFLPRPALAAPADAARGKALTLVHAGRLGEGKGSFLTVELCAALKRRGVPFEARIVGSAEPAVLRRLHALIAARGLERDLPVQGWAEEGELLALLRRTDVLVHLSRLDSFPLTVLEAMAAGAVPLVMDMAGAGAMVRRFDGHVVPLDAAEPAEAAADWLLAQSPAALRARGAALGEGVRREFAWEARVDALAEAVRLTCR